MTARQAQYTERTVSRAAAPKLKRYAKKVAKKSKAREHRLRREMAAETWVRAPRDPAEFKVRLEAERDAAARRRACAACAWTACSPTSISRCTAATASRSSARTGPASRRSCTS